MGKKFGKKHWIQLFGFVFIIGIGASFYFINHFNYQVHQKIKANLVKHPEHLPTKEMALATSFGFKNLRADIYWLEAIQYIGGNALASEYKKYLYTMLDLITELNPYFEHPYIIGQLLLPSYNYRYENLSQEEQDKNLEQGILIGLKGVEKFCDPVKVDRINNENDLRKIWDEKPDLNGNYQYKNPCNSYNIPYFLAYIYFYYKKDPLSASKYYKLASANTDSIEGAKIMAAIMQGKGGNREKSYFMFINVAKTIESDNNLCFKYADQLEQIGAGVFINKTIGLSKELISDISKTRTEVFGEFNEKKEMEELSDTKCSNYVNKAVRELNLAFIEQGNEKYKKDHEGKSAINAQILFDTGYIDYLPIDYQQYKNYGIEYIYNEEIGNFDYDMGYD